MISYKEDLVLHGRPILHNSNAISINFQCMVIGPYIPKYLHDRFFDKYI